MKKRTSVYIDADLLEYAKNKKLNLSKLLEEAIRFCKNKKQADILGGFGPPDPGSTPGESACFIFFGICIKD
ncbi:hypothetical protein DRP05_01925 [Archaeoglobales archaeon]|nr:MAG: hypothetical protein DRP05_01925 [Archaeoglobales archaeon]